MKIKMHHLFLWIALLYLLPFHSVQALETQGAYGPASSGQLDATETLTTSEQVTEANTNQQEYPTTQEETSSDRQAVPEGIIQTDDQFRVQNTSLDPYRKVVRLETFFGLSPLYGSGVMIAPDLVLTAAHNVYNNQTGQWSEDIWIRPGQNGEAEPYGAYHASRLFILKGYQQEVTGEAKSYDMAVIKLSQSVDARVGYLPVVTQQSQGERIQIPGYPVNTSNKIGFMYSMVGEVTAINENLLEYLVDTEGGQSGSPVLNQKNEVIGIHTLGFVEQGQYTYNAARRVLQDSLDMIAFAKGEQTDNPNVLSKWMVTVPVYRLYHSGIQRHHYTKDGNEVNHLKTVGWVYEGEAFQTVDNGIPVHRLYSSITKEHFYTTNTHEKDVLVTRGWIYENIAWYSQGETPIYRLYHKGLKVHLYTKDANERATLVKRGWVDEKIAWYAWSS